MAHIMHHYFPDRKIVGWELDPEVINLGRKHMSLASLEQKGCLVFRFQTKQPHLSFQRKSELEMPSKKRRPSLEALRD